MYLSKNIKHLRKKGNLKQEDLAFLLNVNFSTVSAYEREKSFPSFEILLKLSEIFSVTLDELVFRDIEKEGLVTVVGEEQIPYKADKKSEQRFVALLERRVDELERVIKEENPEKAKELGIE